MNQCRFPDSEPLLNYCEYKNKSLPKRPIKANPFKGKINNLFIKQNDPAYINSLKTLHFTKFWALLGYYECKN